MSDRNPDEVKKADGQDAPDASATRSGRGDFHAFDLTAFIRAKRALRGAVPVAALSRLVAELPADAPPGARDEVIEWTAEGGSRREVRRDAGREDAGSPLTPSTHTVSQPYLTLQIHGRTWLECQRCMRAFEFPIDIETVYKVMDSEEAADAIALDDAESEVIVGSQAFDLLDLIDEEVVLSMPMVPKHDVCSSVHQSVVSGPDGRLGVDELDALAARHIADAPADARVDALPEALSDAPGVTGRLNDGAAVPNAPKVPKADLGRPHPFAGLADLRKRLGDQDDDGSKNH